jgi:polyribonucleotide nucleotidyltransferase
MIEAGANQLSEQDTIEAIDFGYEAVTELIKAQENLLKDLGIKQVKPSEPEIDTTLASYLEKNCTKYEANVVSISGSEGLTCLIPKSLRRFS